MPKSKVDLVAGFLGPWETDFSEVDGNRTYAVADQRKAFLEEGGLRERMTKARIDKRNKK